MYNCFVYIVMQRNKQLCLDPCSDLSSVAVNVYLQKTLYPFIDTIKLTFIWHSCNVSVANEYCCGVHALQFSNYLLPCFFTKKTLFSSFCLKPENVAKGPKVQAGRIISNATLFTCLALESKVSRFNICCSSFCRDCGLQTFRIVIFWFSCAHSLCSLLKFLNACVVSFTQSKCERNPRMVFFNGRWNRAVGLKYSTFSSSTTFVCFNGRF